MSEIPELKQCKFCKQPARVVNIDGMYYAQCTKPTRNCKHGKYAYLALNKNTAIDLWNLSN